MGEVPTQSVVHDATDVNLEGLEGDSTANIGIHKASKVGAITKNLPLSFKCFDKSDAILLGAKTLYGLYPVETISNVGKICAEVNYVL
ncbi:ATPase family AAA domain-containing protein 1-A isoform 1 [Gossypium australe]|uniref:ATPase family AAA domain-containing protein 1-A isoform 1 n=1 Tax=Gossypium australe TaxID=47621 RepID=A0A5B6WWH5_9ROSI|nr:ATPase family AAA domain-containing protein 1-A isoform 1 [Gossypium australe]